MEDESHSPNHGQTVAPNPGHTSSVNNSPRETDDPDSPFEDAIDGQTSAQNPCTTSSVNNSPRKTDDQDIPINGQASTQNPCPSTSVNNSPRKTDGPDTPFEDAIEPSYENIEIVPERRPIDDKHSRESDENDASTPEVEETQAENRYREDLLVTRAPAYQTQSSVASNPSVGSSVEYVPGESINVKEDWPVPITYSTFSEKTTRKQKKLCTTFPGRLMGYYSRKAGMVDNPRIALLRQRNGNLHNPDQSWRKLQETVFDFVMCTIGGLSGIFSNLQKENIHRCGSFYEGVKVKMPNEFDYNIEIPIESDDLTIELKPVDYYWTRKPNSYEPKRYFIIKPKQKDISNPVFQEYLNASNEIDPKEVHEKFKNQILTRLRSQPSLSGVDNPDDLVKINGPAVTLYSKIDRNRAKVLFPEQYKAKRHRKDLYLSIDLAIALPVPDDWKEIYKADQVGQNGTPQDIDGLRPLLVPSGNYWRLSFSRDETTTIKKLELEKRQCLLAVKYLRDELDPGAEYDSRLLTTYPLKIAFLHQQDEHKDTDDWKFWNRHERAVDMFRNIRQDGAAGRFGNYFLKEDPIFWGSDRSYIESQRLNGYLLDQEKKFLVDGKVHLANCVLAITWHVALLINAILYVIHPGKFAIFGPFESCNYTKELRPSKEAHVVPIRTEERCFDISGCFQSKDDFYFARDDMVERIENAMFVQFLFSLLAICNGFVGTVWVFANRFCKRCMGRQVVYRIYGCGTLIMYIIIWLFSIVSVIIGGFFVIDEANMYACNTYKSVVYSHFFASIGISGALIFLLFVHTIVFLITTCRGTNKRESCCRYGYEYFFFDELYLRCCFYCLCAKHIPDDIEITGRCLDCCLCCMRVTEKDKTPSMNIN